MQEYYSALDLSKKILESYYEVLYNETHNYDYVLASRLLNTSEVCDIVGQLEEVINSLNCYKTTIKEANIEIFRTYS